MQEIKPDIPPRLSHMQGGELRREMGVMRVTTQELARLSGTPARLIKLMRAERLPVSREVADIVRSWENWKGLTKSF